jgi:hypothetical protein
MYFARVFISKAALQHKDLLNGGRLIYSFNILLMLMVRSSKRSCSLLTVLAVRKSIAGHPMASQEQTTVQWLAAFWIDYCEILSEQ